LKKCTAFCKKCKASTTSWNDANNSLWKDVSTLNLSRYVEEIANAIMEAKLKVSDVPGVTKLCIALHQRYVDFLPSLLPTILSTFTSPDNNSTVLKNNSNNKASSDNAVVDARHRRFCLRLLVDLVLTGIITDLKPLLKIITEASGYNQKNNNYNVNDPHLIVSFAKAAGLELLGIIPTSLTHDLQLIQQELSKQQLQNSNNIEPQIIENDPLSANNTSEDDNTANHPQPESASTKQQTLLSTIQSTDDEDAAIANLFQEVQKEALPNDLLITGHNSIQSLEEDLQHRIPSHVPTDVSTTLQTHVEGAYNTLCTMYVTTHKKYAAQKLRCDRDRLLQGTLSESRERNLSDTNKLLDSLKKSTEALSEALQKILPLTSGQEGGDDDGEDEGGADGGLELYKESTGDDDGENALGPFDDEETRSFYCTLPDMVTTIPPALLGYTAEDVEKIQLQNTTKYGTDNDNREGDDTPTDNNNNNDGEAVSGDGVMEPTALDEVELEEQQNEQETKDNDENENDANKDTPHYKLTLLIEQELPDCNRRDKIDELTEKFCVNHGASKNSRKRLQKALFLVPRTRLDLLPYYSRMASILDRVYPEISSTLVTELEQQFHGLARWKKQQNLEGRMRNARFLGELTKFRVAPPIVVLRCLRRCLDDFCGYNVDIACCLLESCGRYLQRTKHTRERLSSLMDTMLRIRKAKIFDERSVALINSAFFMVNPPKSLSRKQAKVLPPMEDYIQNLLMVQLVPEDKMVSFASKQILRLPWNDPTEECGAMVVKYMLKACRKGRYKVVGAIAQVVASLRRTKSEVVVRVIDSVLEKIQWALEHPSIRDQQRTVVNIRLLGELHRNALVASTIIFEQLYNLINFGHDIPQALKEVSEKQNAVPDTTFSVGISSDLLSGPGKVTQTIQEDEEMDIDKEDDDSDIDKEQTPMGTSFFSRYDPRVPFVLDPPTSVFRVTLICTLLDTVASTILTNNNRGKLDQFLAAFQRYLFTKTTLPTEVEFALLDTFDLLDSTLKNLEKETKKNSTKNLPAGFRRYKTWLEAHNATVVVEEVNANATAKAEARLLVQAGVQPVQTEMDGASVKTDEMEDSIVVSDDDDDDTLGEDQMSINSKDDDTLEDIVESGDESGDDDSSFSGAESNDDASMEGSEDEMDEDSEEDSDEDSDDDDQNYDDDEEIDEVAAQEAYMRQLEEEAFERELRRLTLEAVEKGKVAARTGSGGKVSDTMPTASQIVRKKTVETSNSGMDSEISKKIALGGASGMSFKLLKRGHKGRVEAKEFVVPTQTNLAKLATKQDDEAEKERHMLKARVLQYEAESAEQSFSGGNVYMEQAKLPVVRNRPLSMEDIDRNFGSNSNRRSSGPHGSSRDGSDRARSTFVYGSGRGGGKLFDAGRGRSGR